MYISYPYLNKGRRYSRRRKKKCIILILCEPRLCMACLKENLHSFLFPLTGVAVVYGVYVFIFVSCHKALSLSDV